MIGGLKNVFPDSEFGESFTDLFQALAFTPVISWFVVSIMDNRGGDNDFVATVTMRRRHMKRMIKRVDFKS
jgi:hypothetical protein